MCDMMTIANTDVLPYIGDLVSLTNPKILIRGNKPFLSLYFCICEMLDIN